MVQTAQHKLSEIPSGMIEVTKEQFFAALFADKRDIMPSVAQPYTTRWETTDRLLWGWKSDFDAKKGFFIYPNQQVAHV